MHQKKILLSVSDSKGLWSQGVQRLALLARCPAAAQGWHCSPLLQDGVSALQKAPVRVWPSRFGVQLRDSGGSKPEENFSERSKQKNSMKTRQVIRFHPHGYPRSEGLQERTST